VGVYAQRRKIMLPLCVDIHTHTHTHRYEEKISIPSTAALLEGIMQVEIEVRDDQQSDDDVSSTISFLNLFFRSRDRGL
jgi:aminoglycoside N3'-acetyltransferase